MTAKKPVDQIENLKPNLEKKDLQRCHIHISFDTNQGRKFFRDLRATKCTLHRLCGYRSWPRRRYSISTLSLSIFISNKFSIHTPCTPPWVWGLLSIIGALIHYHQVTRLDQLRLVFVSHSSTRVNSSHSKKGPSLESLPSVDFGLCVSGQINAYANQICIWNRIASRFIFEAYLELFTNFLRQRPSWRPEKKQVSNLTKSWLVREGCVKR